MMAPQCSSCGTYFTSNEAFCARCGAARVANPYQNQNPYQTPYGQPAQQQQANGGNFFQRYYTPQRIVRRIIIGRIIGLAIFVLFFVGCVAFLLLGGVLSALSNH